MKTRLFALVVCVAMLIASFATVASAEGLTYQGEITFYAQALTPLEATETNPNPPTAFWQVEEAWEAANPGIDIVFLESVAAGTDYATWLKTKMAGGTAPDIFWCHASNIHGAQYPMGCNVELGEILQRPNKYVEGNEHWIDMFPEMVNNANAGPNGEQPVINADYVGTAVYYNVDLFDAAGINMADYGEDVCWTEYVDICEKLLANGTTPWAFSFGNNADDTAYISWFTRLFNTSFYYNDFDKLSVTNPEKTTLTAAEVVLGFKNGYFGVDNEKWMAWWPIFKEQVDKYMPADCVSAASTRDTVASQFYTGQIAMLWDGSWAPNSFEAAEVAFPIGSFPFPYMDSAASEYASDKMISGCVGGPYAAFQYAISSEKANSTMTEEKLEACIDWLMFITEPANCSLVCNDNGSFIPTVAGSVPSEANAGLVALLNGDAHVVDDGSCTFTGSAFMDLYYRTFQQYLAGSITLDEAKDELRDDMWETIDTYIEDNELEDFIEQYAEK